MALREGLAQRVQPFLEPGEHVQAIFNAQSGASPYWVHRRYHKDVREGNAAILGTPSVA